MLKLTATSAYRQPIGTPDDKMSPMVEKIVI
jgi:hypothetical protein